ncbi:MAG: hypothetical protein IT561_18140 [Alphaproteobacteria bacterium]|nr:hypothetical protein [Alphaproteobacteria bacterium]
MTDHWRCLLVSGLAAAAAVAALPARAAEPPVLVELNRLEERGADCRAYLVLENRGKAAFDAYKLDLVVFDKGGVVARRLALDVGPLRAEKRGVKVFDLAGLGCADVSSVLVNDVIECGGKDQAKDQDCVALLEVRSRTAAKLTK